MKILGWIIAVPVIAFALFASARFLLCGPDKEVVKVATPMVQRIADYIVKNGVPESLADIEGLPYALEGCERKIRYRKRVNTSYKNTELKKNADFAIIDEKCYVMRNHQSFLVNFHFLESYSDNFIDGTLRIESGKTSVGTTFVYSDNLLSHDGIGTGFDNRFGFCRPFKQ